MTGTAGSVCPVCLRHATSTWVTTEGGKSTRHWRHAEHGTAPVECSQTDEPTVDRHQAAQSLDPRIGRGS